MLFNHRLQYSFTIQTMLCPLTDATTSNRSREMAMLEKQNSSTTLKTSFENVLISSKNYKYSKRVIGRTSSEDFFTMVAT